MREAHLKEKTQKETSHIVVNDLLFILLSSSSDSDDNDEGPKRFTITTKSKEREWKLRKEMATRK